VIAGTDLRLCYIRAVGRAGDRLAKLKTMAEGARLASKQLWK